MKSKPVIISSKIKIVCFYELILLLFQEIDHLDNQTWVSITAANSFLNFLNN